MLAQGRHRNHSLPLSIGCYLVQLGCDPQVRNRKGKTAADILADSSICDVLTSYVHRRKQLPSNPQPTVEPTDENASHNSVVGNAVEVVGQTPDASAECAAALAPAESADMEVKQELDGDDKQTENELKECLVCCESPPNIKFEPCGHKIACSECAQRMKKCLECHQLIVGKITIGNISQ